MDTLPSVLALPSTSYRERKLLPDSPGVYFAVIDGMSIAYVGSTGSLRGRWRVHNQRVDLLSLGEVRIHYLEAACESLAEIEQLAMDVFSPPFNRAPALIAAGPSADDSYDDIGDDEFILSAAARELGVSHVTAWRHIQAGKLKARKVGPIYLIKRRDLDAFIATRRGVGRPRNASPPPPPDAGG